MPQPHHQSSLPRQRDRPVAEGSGKVEEKEGQTLDKTQELKVGSAEHLGAQEEYQAARGHQGRLLRGAIFHVSICSCSSP